MKDKLLLAALVLLLLVNVPLGALEVPYLASRINDLADLLSPGAEQRLESTLAQLERDTGAQLAVLTVPSLEGEPLGDFSIRVLETWKLGRKGIDDGALLLIARDDRKIRIEVGYGLEPTLTDVACKRIISNLISPRFREGDFDGGVEAAANAIAGTVRGQEDLIPADPPARKRSGEKGWPLMLGLWVVLWLVFGRRRRRGWFGGFYGGGGFSGGGGSSGGGGFGGFSGGGGSFGGGGASGSW